MTKARAIFGCAVTSAMQAYAKVSKLARKKGLDVYLCNNHEDIHDCEIVVFDSIERMYSQKQNIHENMIIIICDGPLLIESVRDMQPLDYDKNLSFEYKLKRADFGPVISVCSSNKPPVSLVPKQFDHIKQIANLTATESQLIQCLNKLMAISNMVARFNVRRFLCEALLGMRDLEDFESVCKSQLGKLTKPVEIIVADLQKQISKNNFTNLAHAIHEIRTEASIVQKCAKKHGVDLFELRYMNKMVAEYFPLDNQDDSYLETSE